MNRDLRQARVRILNALESLNKKSDSSYMLADLAEMATEAELLLSAICLIYNELHNASRKAGLINIRIDRQGRIGRKPRKTEVSV